MDDEGNKKEEINKYLGNFKRYLSQMSYIFVMREKNKKTLSEMSFTTLDVQKELLKLEYKDYLSGPKPDEDPKRKGDIWEFGKNINKEDM